MEDAYTARYCARGLWCPLLTTVGGACYFEASSHVPRHRWLVQYSRRWYHFACNLIIDRPKLSVDLPCVVEDDVDAANASWALEKAGEISACWVTSNLTTARRADRYWQNEVRLYFRLASAESGDDSILVKINSISAFVSLSDLSGRTMRVKPA